VCSEHAALNMAHQGLLAQQEPLCMIATSALIGMPLDAPLTPLSPVYVLPMLHVSMSKGTGIVTSVPSDAPDDYIALSDLKKKSALREKYNVSDACVMPFEPIPVIEVPYQHDKTEASEPSSTTQFAAQVACEEYKVSSQNDREKLLLAKNKCYKIGFYEGTLAVGEYKGQSVQEVKSKVRSKLIEEGLAYAYAEPEKEVLSRTGSKCVVALTDQWYICYGEEAWKRNVTEHLDDMRLYSDETRSKFQHALGWLCEWGCSRSFGLGTRLPWDETYLIESLSDSTIYMAFYTVCHVLQQGALDGSELGEAGVLASEMTLEVWDHIFLGGPAPTNTKIPPASLEKMRREFEYWYPVDLRVSGRDLIQNHLTFYMYAHAALFEREKWPRGIRTNGHLLLDGDKMSKSTGNFMTLRGGVEQYSADALRFALALAGDSNEDANFEHTIANAAILKLSNELQFVETTLSSDAGFGSEKTRTICDEIFMNEMARIQQETDNCMEAQQYREAIVVGWDGLQNARDRYRAMSTVEGMRRDILVDFIRLQTLLLSPFCPHYAEHVWEKLGNAESVMHARWPEQPPINHTLSRITTYFDKVLAEARDKVLRARSKGKEGISKVTLFIAREYADWQQATLLCIRDAHEKGEDLGKTFKATLLQRDSISAHKAMGKKVLPFAQFYIDELAVRGVEALELNTPFDEEQVLSSVKEYMERELKVDAIVFSDWPPTSEHIVKSCTPAAPGRPSVFLG